MSPISIWPSPRCADYLVTWDKDLLDLMQDASFRAQYPRLTILNPVALLQILTPPPQQQP